MKYFMAVVIVPLGLADKAVEAANEAGVTGATIIRARGSDSSVPKGVLGFNLETDEEIILITAAKETIVAVCDKIHNAFINYDIRGGSVYVLPIQRVSDGGR